MSIISLNLSYSNCYGIGNDVWFHYAAVAPTQTMHGSKEFWTNSVDNCATHTLDKPIGIDDVNCIECNFAIKDSFASLEQTDDRYIPSFNQRDGIEPLLLDNNQCSYGLYPQDNVDDPSLISSLNGLTTPEPNGWFYYNGNYYVKLTASPFRDSCKFNNDIAINAGATYWFKCSPIIWNILRSNGNKHHLVSNDLVDVRFYSNFLDSNHNLNNYEYSEIRRWLNSDFYNTAFGLNDSFIQTNIVDNSASTTDTTTNPYICSDTLDKVFLLSYQDYINCDYGFSTSEGADETRYCKTTDWSKAKGASYSFDFPYENHGCYWTRSPASTPITPLKCNTWVVSVVGSLFEYNIYSDLNIPCTRPSIIINI